MDQKYQFQDGEVYCHHTLTEHPNPDDFPIHAHETAELYYFIAGSGRFLIEGTEYHLTPGDLLVMRPAEVHRLFISREEPYERIAIHFPVTLFDGIDPNHLLMRALYDRPFGNGNLYKTDEDPILQSAFREFTPVKGLERFQIFSILLQVLTELAVIREQEEGPTSRSEDLGSVLVAYVNAHLFEDISLESLSHEFGVSVSQLNRIFRKASGTSVWKYISIKRLLAAHARIIRGDSASEAAYACGFGDYSSFFRIYKKHFGRAPSSDKKR